MNGVISIKDYFIDLFSGFYFDKTKIHEQIQRDYPRMSIYMNSLKIKNIIDFYRIINNLNINRVYKRMIWVMPTQVSLVKFYYILQQHYQKINSNYAVAELEDGNTYSNDFKIHIDFLDKHIVNIRMTKNFRVLDIGNRNIPTVYYVFLTVKIDIGKTKNLEYEWQEISK
jgi:hypothetical protein